MGLIISKAQIGAECKERERVQMIHCLFFKILQSLSTTITIIIKETKPPMDTRESNNNNNTRSSISESDVYKVGLFLLLLTAHLHYYVSLPSSPHTHCMHS